MYITVYIASLEYLINDLQSSSPVNDRFKHQPKCNRKLSIAFGIADLNYDVNLFNFLYTKLDLLFKSVCFFVIPIKETMYIHCVTFWSHLSEVIR